MVLGLRGVLQAWLDHRQEVLVRRSRHRQAAIARRLEVLDGYLAVFLNLDEVIRIIREEDQPKPALDGAVRDQRRAGGGDPEHAAAVVAAAGGDRDPQGASRTLTKEAKELSMALLDGCGAAVGADRRRSWRRRGRSSGAGPLGARRTVIGDVPAAVDRGECGER